MMLKSVLLSFIAFASVLSCEDEALIKDDKECSQTYQGRLALKGICMNYVIEVLDPINEDWVEAEWVNPFDETTYTNAFRLGSVCSFDDSIKEGDLFYFEASLEPFEEQLCAVCQAYSPTPFKTLYVRVCDSNN